MRKAVEVRVKYADWSDRPRAGLSSASGEAKLTAAPSEAGGLSLYLERDAGALLHVELGEDAARQFYEFLKGRFGKPPPRRRGGKRPQ